LERRKQKKQYRALSSASLTIFEHYYEPTKMKNSCETFEFL